MSHLAPEACWDAFTDAQRSLVKSSGMDEGISTADTVQRTLQGHSFTRFWHDQTRTLVSDTPLTTPRYGEYAKLRLEVA